MMVLKSLTNIISLPERAYEIMYLSYDLFLQLRSEKNDKIFKSYRLLRCICILFLDDKINSFVYP